MIQLSLNSEMNFVIHPELQQLFCSIACSIIGGPRESSYFTKFSTTKGKTSKIKTHYSSLKKKQAVSILEHFSIVRKRTQSVSISFETGCS